MRCFGIAIGGVVLLLCSTAPAVAQPQRLVVTVQNANIRLEPTTRSAIVGRATLGAAFEVIGQEGEWIHVRVSTGGEGERNGWMSLQVGRLEAVVRPRSAPPVSLSTTPAPDAQPSPGVDRGSATQPPAAVMRSAGASAPSKASASTPAAAALPSSEAQPTPPTLPRTSSPHVLGLGGRFGGFTFGPGGSVRIWPGDRVGLDVGVSRFSIGDASTLEASVWQIAPVVVYRLGQADPDDDVTMRPYVGGGLNIYRSTMTFSRALGGDSESSTEVGGSGFGGVEATFNNVPRLTLSIDAGYFQTAVPFAGVQVGGFGAQVAAHWYVR